MIYAARHESVPAHLHRDDVLDTGQRPAAPRADGDKDRDVRPRSQLAGLNHRAAKPRKIQQDFGYSNGKIGGIITMAGEPAYYAKKFPTNVR